MTSYAIPRPRSLFGWIGKVRRECYVFSPYLVGVLLLHGGFFFHAGSPFEQHFLAFSGMRELYIAVCCFAAGLAIFEGLRRRRFFAGDLMLILLVLSYAFGSAMFASLKFGQPILYGLFEERRILLGFGLFAILAAYYQFNNRPEALIGAVNWTALIYLSLGLVMQAGLLGDLASRDIPVFDPRKYRILVGSDMYSASIVIGAVLMIRHRALENIVPVLVGVTGLLLISQTRSSTVVITIAVVLILALSSFRHLLFAAATAVIASVAFFIPKPLSGDTGLFGEPVAELDVRLRTANTIISELQKNDWIGMGALSLQWQDGFHRIYDRFFYLSDVGAVGELYRFGGFLVLIYAGLALVLFNFYRQPMEQRGRSITSGLLIWYFVNALAGGLIAFTGSNLALILAFAVAFGAHGLAPKTMGSRFRVRI